MIIKELFQQYQPCAFHNICYQLHAAGDLVSVYSLKAIE